MEELAVKSRRGRKKLPLRVSIPLFMGVAKHAANNGRWRKWYASVTFDVSFARWQQLIKENRVPQSIINAKDLMEFISCLENNGYIDSDVANACRHFVNGQQVEDK